MTAAQSVLSAVRTVCDRELPSARAVVMTGSIARDEAWFYPHGAMVNCAGDAEFLAIFQKRSLPTANHVQRLVSRIRAELKLQGIQCPLSAAIVDTGYLRKMLPHVFGYELRTCGKVLCGDPAVLDLIPPFTPHDIPREDAWRLLANRMVELVEYVGSDWSVRTPLTIALRYRLAKLYLDMATSYLLFLGRFEPGYRRRCEILQAVATERNEGPFSSFEAFAERVQAATAFKLAGDGNFGESAGSLVEAIQDARALWDWELTTIAGSADRLPPQSFLQRLRGWAFVARRCGRNGWREWPRWITRALRISPRYGVYSAASLLMFAIEGKRLIHEQIQFDHLKAARRLPVVNKIPADWRSAAAEIAWNYHEFLEWTRA